MAQSREARVQSLPTLYGRIGYEVPLEQAAFRRLAELDLDGCRAAFGDLLERLDFSGSGTHRRDAVLLLLDLLQRVNLRLFRSAGDDPTYQSNRVELLQQFALLDDPDEARKSFLTALGRLFAPFQNGQAPARPLVDQALAYIEDNYHRRLSLSEVARQLHISPNYLSRVFRRQTGHTLTFYIHRVRLERARLLLAAGGRSISEIAYLVGYQNYRDFYRNFVKYEKASPRQAQRRLAPLAPRKAQGPSQETPR